MSQTPISSLEHLAENSSKRLADFSFSMVGSGKVGSSLASWLVAGGAQAVKIAGGRNRVELARRLGAQSCPAAELESSGLDLLLITTPDHSLAELATSLARRPQARVALHTAGCFDGEVLAPLRGPSTAVGSLHPLKAFSAPLLDPQMARGTFFAWDGDSEAQDLAARLVAFWGGEGRTVTGGDRVLYHLAASLAAGGVVTLMALAASLADHLDLPRQVVLGYFNLAKNALDQAAVADHPAQAITGPAARGDRLTLAKHRNALVQSAPEALELFDTLTAMTRQQVEFYSQNSPSLEEPELPDRR